MKLYEEAFPTSDLRINEESMIISGVKVLGAKSRNGRVYTEQAMRNAAKLYDGARVFLDHDNGERKTKDHVGCLRNPVVSGDGVFAEFHYLGNHPESPKLVECAKRMPHTFGFSHHAEGSSKRRNGTTFVEDVTTVHSVDIVTKPATTNGFFEEIDMADTTEITLREAAKIDSPWGKAVAAALKEMEGEEGGMDPAMTAEAPAEASSDDQAKSAFKAMVMAAFDDDNLDKAATLKRIKEILDAQERLMAKTAEAEAPAEGGDDEAATESVKLLKDVQNELRESRNEIKALRKEREIDEVLESFSIRRSDLSADRLSELRKKDTPQAMRDYLEDMPEAEKRGRRVRSTGSFLMESERPTETPDAEAFAKRVGA